MPLPLPPSMVLRAIITVIAKKCYSSTSTARNNRQPTKALQSNHAAPLEATKCKLDINTRRHIILEYGQGVCVCSGQYHSSNQGVIAIRAITFAIVYGYLLLQQQLYDCDSATLLRLNNCDSATLRQLRLYDSATDTATLRLCE